MAQQLVLLEQKVLHWADLMSSVTGLPITKQSFSPDLDSYAKEESGQPAHIVPFRYDLSLGKNPEKYEIFIQVDLTDKYSLGEWLPSTSLGASFNDVQFTPEMGWVSISSSFLTASDFSRLPELRKIRAETLMRCLGGIDTEVAFTDFEYYTIDSLKGEHDYFQNLYLFIMTHMKERGLEMPPILSKNEDIQEAIRRGDVELANRVLAQETILKGGNYPARCQAHMFAEADKIREMVNYMKQRHDPSVPLTEKFTYLNTTRIEGSSKSKRYNLLVVENDLEEYGQFTRRIISALNKDGRYGGTQVLRDFQLHSCMQICETGQIDLVLFDWTNPSIYEALMVGGGTQTPGESLGRAETTMSFDDDGNPYGFTSQGKLFDEDRLRKETERLDIRSLWMDKISTYCLELGIQPPPYFIFRSEAEYQDISNIISQKLGNSIK